MHRNKYANDNMVQLTSFQTLGQLIARLQV